MTGLLPLGTTLPRGRYFAFDTSLSGPFPQTTGGGTSFLTGVTSLMALAAGETNEYVMVSAQVVAEYERKIADLQRTLLHYRALIANLLGPRDIQEELAEAYRTTPLDNESVRVIDSVILARVTSAATFRDFDQEDL